MWVANLDDDSVSKIDPRAAACGRHHVDREERRRADDGRRSGLDARRARRDLIAHRSELRPGRQARAAGPTTRRLQHGIPNPVAAGTGSVWAANGFSAVARVAERSGDLKSTVDVGNEPAGIAHGAGATWVADDLDDNVSQIDRAGSRGRRDGGRSYRQRYRRRRRWRLGGRHRRRHRHAARSCHGSSHRHHSTSARDPPESRSAPAPSGSRTAWTGPCRALIRARTAWSPGSTSAAAPTTSPSPRGRSGSRSRPERHRLPRRRRDPAHPAADGLQLDRSGLLGQLRTAGVPTRVRDLRQAPRLPRPPGAAGHATRAGGGGGDARRLGRTGGPTRTPCDPASASRRAGRSPRSPSGTPWSAS